MSIYRLLVTAENVWYNGDTIVSVRRCIQSPGYSARRARKQQPPAGPPELSAAKQVCPQMLWQQEHLPHSLPHARIAEYVL